MATTLRESLSSRWDLLSVEEGHDMEMFSAASTEALDTRKVLLCRCGWNRTFTFKDMMVLRPDRLVADAIKEHRAEVLAYSNPTLKELEDLGYFTDIW
jgi:hypothetical protein